MTAPRASFTMTLLPDGKALVAGGSTWAPFGASGMLHVCCADTVELYDPNKRLFAAAGSMAAGRAGHTATLLQTGQVLILGGSSGGSSAVALASAELYTPPRSSLPT